MAKDDPRDIDPAPSTENQRPNAVLFRQRFLTIAILAVLVLALAVHLVSQGFIENAELLESSPLFEGLFTEADIQTWKRHAQFGILAAHTSYLVCSVLGVVQLGRVLARWLA